MFMAKFFSAENRPARFNRGGGGGYSGPSRGRGGYFDGGYNRPPRGGPNSYYGGGGYNNRGGGGGYGYQQHPPQMPGPYGYSPYAYGGGKSLIILKQYMKNAREHIFNFQRL